MMAVRRDGRGRRREVAVISSRVRRRKRRREGRSVGGIIVAGGGWGRVEVVTGSGFGWGARALSDSEPDADLTLGAAGWAPELEGSDRRGWSSASASASASAAGGVAGEGVLMEEVLERGSGGADEGLGGLGRLGVEDIEGEEEKGIGRGEGEGEALVPDRAGGAGVVGLAGGAAIGVEVDDDVRLEVAVAPVDVLQVIRGDDGDFEVEGPRRRRWGRRRRRRREEAPRRVHRFRPIKFP